MAILYNEAYKPHDSAFERAWQKYKPDAAFGIANMHRATFDEVKQGRDFADRKWEELPDDRDLAVEAEAWYLHDLAAQLPARWSASYSRNDLLALGYNTGAGNMLAFARGATPAARPSRTSTICTPTGQRRAGRAAAEPVRPSPRAPSCPTVPRRRGGVPAAAGREWLTPGEVAERLGGELTYSTVVPRPDVGLLQGVTALFPGSTSGTAS